MIYVLANKSDLVQESDYFIKKINNKRKIEILNKFRLDFYTECSAKNNTNVEETFYRLVKGKLTKIKLRNFRKE